MRYMGCLVLLAASSSVFAQRAGNPPPGPSTRQATTRPVSMKEARRIVFLVDTRLPAQALPWLRDELRLAIDHLTDDQLLTIVVLRPQNQVPKMFSSNPVRATAAAKEQAVDFLRALESDHTTNPVPGIRKAVELQPDWLCFIPDQTTPQTDAVRQAFRPLRGRLNIVLFAGHVHDPVEFLRTLAAEHGGIAMDQYGDEIEAPKAKVEVTAKPESRPSVFEK